MYDHCAGTVWEWRGKKRFECIGHGLAVWKDTEKNEKLSKAHLCPCRGLIKRDDQTKELIVSEYRKDWVSKYLKGGVNDKPEADIITTFGQKTKSFYINTKDKNINSSIMTISWMTKRKKLRVIQGVDTVEEIGTCTDSGRYEVDRNGMLIVLDAHMIPVNYKTSEHLGLLINLANAKIISLIIAGNMSWKEFSIEHKIEKIKFDNIGV